MYQGVHLAYNFTHLKYRVWDLQSCHLMLVKVGKQRLCEITSALKWITWRALRGGQDLVPVS